MNFKAMGILTSTLLVTATSFAILPEGSFKGKSNLLTNKHDVMSLIIKKDNSVSQERYTAIVAEYTRVDGRGGKAKAVVGSITRLSEKLTLTNWVPRIYAFIVEPNGALEYSMKPAMVTQDGRIEANTAIAASSLKLAKNGSLDEAILVRMEKGRAVESITQFDEKLSSTLEPLVTGTFYLSTDSTGGDYMRKSVNANIQKEKDDVVMSFFTKDVQGRFTLSEQQSRFFTLQSRTDDQTGAEKVVGKIAVFVDIVNWKSFGIERFTTEEMLLINPDNAKDVGFLYERHLPEKKDDKKKAQIEIQD